jgi:hypothetical protein
MGVGTRSVEGRIILICLFKSCCMNVWTRRYCAGGIAPSAGELHVKLSVIGCGESQCCWFLLYCQSSWIARLFSRIKSSRHSIRFVFIIVYYVIASVFIVQCRGNTNPGWPNFVCWPSIFSAWCSFSPDIQTSVSFYVHRAESAMLLWGSQVTP